MFGGVLASTWYCDFKEHVELCTCARKTRVQKRRAEAEKTAAPSPLNAVASLFASIFAGAMAFVRREDEAFAAA